MSRKLSTVDRVVAVLRHDRCQETWIVRAVIGADGNPAIQRIARIGTVYPRDGAGTVRVAVTDWTSGDAVHHVGTAGGYGYDKRTAAMAGATIGGFEIGDHSDYRGRPTLRDLARREGWEIIGD